MVDLRPFFQAWQELRAESDKLDGYATSATFWAVYDAKLRASATLVGPTVEDMRTNSGWGSPDNPNGASAAFYARVDAGLASIRDWLAGTAAVRDAFATLSTNVGNHFHTVDMHRAWLLSQNKVAAGTVARITEQDGEVTVGPDIAAEVDRRVAESLRLHTELKGQFADTVRALNTLNAQAWLGPSAPPAPATTTAAPGGVPPGAPAGGPGGAPGGVPAGGEDAAGGPAGPGEDLGADPAGAGPAATPPTDLPSDLPTDVPSDLSTDLPGAPDSLGDTRVSTPDIGEIPPLPSSPELAGTPTPTLPPPTSSLDVPPSLGGTPPTGGSTVDRSPLPVPLPPAPRGPAGSTLDRAGTRVAAEPSPRPPGGSGGGGTGATTGPGGAFYPPMGMFPPGGAGTRAAVQPGEADFAGGPMRRARGAETWRAGLQPHLLGRGGDHDEEPAFEPPPDDDVLDDELWQVP